MELDPTANEHMKKIITFEDTLNHNGNLNNSEVSFLKNPHFQSISAKSLMEETANKYTFRNIHGLKR